MEKLFCCGNSQSGIQSKNNLQRNNTENNGESQTDHYVQNKITFLSAQFQDEGQVNDKQDQQNYEKENFQRLQKVHGSQKQQITQNQKDNVSTNICSNGETQNNYQEDNTNQIKSYRNTHETDHPTIGYQNMNLQDSEKSLTIDFNIENKYHKNMIQSQLSSLSIQDVVLNTKIDQVAYDILRNGKVITKIQDTPIECLKNLSHDYLIIHFTQNEFKFKIYASLQIKCRKLLNQLLEKYKKKYLQNEKAHIQYNYFNKDEDELIFFIVNTSLKKQQNLQII